MNKIIEPVNKFCISAKLSKRICFTAVTAFVIGTAAIGFAFIDQSVHDAADKDFWTDEFFELNECVRPVSFQQLILKGAPFQGNNAPLDYLIMKVLDNFHRPQVVLSKASDVFFPDSQTRIY